METDFESCLASSFNATVSPHLLTVVFKKSGILVRMLLMALWGIWKLLGGYYVVNIIYSTENWL